MLFFVVYANIQASEATKQAVIAVQQAALAAKNAKEAQKNSDEAQMQTRINEGILADARTRQRLAQEALSKCQNNK